MMYLLPCLVGFLTTMAVMPIVIRVATDCRCLDVPGIRRIHKKITPRWGGVAFFAGVLPVLISAGSDSSMTAYLAASCILILIGIIDDRIGLGWKAKLAGIVAAATIVIFKGNAVVHHLGTYEGIGSVDLGRFSIPFTYLGIIGVTNAINLLDGLNGLAGGVSLLGFLFLGIAAALSGNVPVAVLCFAFVGALGAFLRYNFPDARIFMGDSGSNFLGFSLSLMAVFLTQNASFPVEPMFPVLVLLLPIFDTLRVLVIRILKRKNPFKADTSHLHYLIVRKGVSQSAAVVALWSMTAVFGCMGLYLVAGPSVSYLVWFAYASLFMGLFTASLAWKWHMPGEHSFPVFHPEHHRSGSPAERASTYQFLYRRLLPAYFVMAGNKVVALIVQFLHPGR